MTSQPEPKPIKPTFNKGDQVVAPIDRIPPHDLEAEMSLLGSLMLNREAIGDILPLIHRSESHRFYLPDHRKIFEVLVDMYDRGDAIDLVTVRNELDRHKLLDEVGGVDYIVQLAESVPSHLHAEHYARLVCDKALLRDLIDASAKMTEHAYSHSESAKEILDAAEHALFKVTDQRITEQASPVRDYIYEIFEQISSREGIYITGVPTRFTELDDLLSGLQNGEMIVIAARPSMGKTALGLNMAENMANEGRAVAFFSLEMSRQAIAQRLLCSRGRVDSHKLRRGMLNDGEINSLHAVCDELTKMQLLVDDTPGMSVLELRAKSRRLKIQHNIACILVDYLQLMHNPGKIESRQQEVAEISRGIKALARELNIPIVVMSQLNRNPEGRTDNRPRMSDLRESGAIEQDADVIMLLHREEYYKGESTPHELRGVAELILAKQRNGPIGKVPLIFNQKFTRFDNLAVGTNVSYEASEVHGGAGDYEEPAPF
ncbi:MAG: replicative DNA helicase [Planctomycetota bacterium]|jgi:replicative DNA helicase